MSKFKTLLLAHHGGNNQIIHLAVKQFCENVTRRTEGRIAIATIPNSSLGNLAELLRLVMDGTADMALPPYDRLASCAPRFSCISLPFVFDDHAHVDRMLDGEYKEWAGHDLDAAGIVHLGSWEWGFRQISNSRRPILRPEDICGLKIRVPPIALYRATIRAFGGVPVMVEYSRIVSVIRQGLIDGQENPVSIIDSLGLQRDQKFISLLNYSYGTLAHIINRNRFESLTVEQQTILGEESHKAGLLMRTLARSQEVERLDVFASQGVQIDRPDTGLFKALMGPVYASLGELLGVENVRVFMDMANRQRRAPTGEAR